LFFDSGAQGEWTNVFTEAEITIPAEFVMEANSYLLLEK